MGQQTDAAWEEGLVLRAVEGDGEAFGDLYELYLDRMYRYVHFRVGNERDAEDLTELIFLKAWEAMGGFDPHGGGFRAWIFRVAHNVVVDHYRAHRPTQPIPETPQGEESLPSVGDDWIDRALDRDALKSAIRRLSEDEQTLLVLRFVEEMPHREVSRILQRSEQACRVLQYRALRKLQDTLTPQPA